MKNSSQWKNSLKWSMAALVLTTTVIFVQTGSAQGFRDLRGLSASDSFFDFEVYYAEPVQARYQIKARQLDGNWEYLVEYNYNAALETSTPGDRLSWDSWYGANSYAKNALRRGDILDYIVVESIPNPSWQLAGVFDTRDQAESIADTIEAVTNFSTKIQVVQE